MDAPEVTIRFSLTLGEREMESSVRLPTAPATLTQILPVLLGLDSALVQAAEEEIAGQGLSISCRAGCGACCRQFAPIGEAEARYLAELVDSMPPERQAEIRRRFQQALEKLDAAGVLERARTLYQVPHASDRQLFALEYFAAGVPCPFLEHESCSIHPHRPLICREYLVTSPPDNCSNPSPKNVERILLTLQPSLTLFHLGRPQPFFIPLVDALDWVARHPVDEQPRAPAPKLFRDFLEKLIPPPEPGKPEQSKE